LALPYDLEYVKLCLDEDTTVLELYYIKDCLSLVHEKIFNHFAITVKSAYKTYRQMLNVKGVEILSEPELDKQKTHKLFFIRDPWSNLIEIVENLK
jgi:ferredoxin-fold anticodon binding domain-containing protein